MPWSGSTFTRTNGVFTGSGIWTSDRDAGVKIRSDRHDVHDQDLAAGINATLKKDGANTPTANLPMGGFRHTNVDEGEARNEYAAISQIQDGDLHFGTDTGSANTYAVALTPAITAYTNGMRVIFRAGAANTGASTLNVSGVGAQSLVAADGTALSSGQISANMLIEAVYDVTATDWIALNIPGIATTAEAEAGTNNTQVMTPLRTEEAINVQALRNDPVVSAGTSSAYTLTIPIEGDALSDNEIYQFQAHTDSVSGGITLNITPTGAAATGAKAVVLSDGSNPHDDAMLADSVYYVLYDSGADNYILLNPDSRADQIAQRGTGVPKVEPHENQIFTSSGTFTVPAGVTAFTAHIVGAGGASDGSGGGNSSVAYNAVTATANGGGGSGGADGGGGGGTSGADFGVAGGAGQHQSTAGDLQTTGGSAGLGYGQGAGKSAVAGSLYGGGAGGSNNPSFARGGGGGGGYARKRFVVASGVTTATVTVGGGGTTSGVGANGANGVVVIEY